MRKFKKSPTLEKIEGLGITRHTKAEQVEAWQLISAAEVLIASGFLFMLNGDTAWAKEEVERLDCLAMDTDLDDSLEVAVKNKRHALAAVRCAASVINRAEADWVAEQERRNRSTNGGTSSRRESEARKERKRARDREIRSRMKNKSGKKE